METYIRLLVLCSICIALTTSVTAKLEQEVSAQVHACVNVKHRYEDGCVMATQTSLFKELNIMMRKPG